MFLFETKEPKFEILRSVDKQYYFVLKAANGQVIAQSETYTTKDACNNGIQSVKTNAAIAKIVDLTESVK